SDDNDPALKGRLSLLYQPSSHAANWRPDSYYRVAVGYPGELKNETDVPITVRARASSPILRTSYPARAHVGTELILDASGSYNLQGTPLHVTWKQVAGPAVALTNPHAARLSFVAPPQSAVQAGWEGLCRALMK